MAHAFSLTDGTTTISLTTSGVLLEQYAMGAPQDNEDTVTDTVDILISAATGALVQTAARAIDAMLAAAIRRTQQRVGPHIYVTAQIDSDTAAWRSEIVNGRMELAEDGLNVWANKLARCTLYIERKPWWEGAETQIPLTNGNGTNVTGATGIVVYNNGDESGTSPTKKSNYVQIAAADVVGALPAPLKFELKNKTGGAVQWSKFYLANNAFSDPANFPHILEAEARSAGGTIVASAGLSGGNYVSLIYTGSGTLTWTLAAALLQQTRGRWFRLILNGTFRNATDAQGETVQASIMDNSATYTLWTGPEVRMEVVQKKPLLDIGAIPLPPATYDATWGALTLRLTYKVLSTGATEFLDFVQLTPTDAYRVLRTRLTSIASNALIVDNGIDGVSYVEASAVRYPYLIAEGQPLMVYPGVLQRVLILASQVDGVDVSEKFEARAWYRPRRITL
jgi:hypothetical protein